VQQARKVSLISVEEKEKRPRVKRIFYKRGGT
jgi:hypothetical protein